MITFAILKLDGELETEGFRVTLEIRRGNFHTTDILGNLPPKPELARQLQEHWEDKYRSLAAPYQHRGIQPLGIYQGGSVNRRQAVECQQSAHSLATHFNQWLNEESLRTITEQLRSQLHQEQEICLLIRTQEQRLYKLPWQQWNLLADFPHTTVAFALLEWSNFPTSSENFIREKTRILAILGHQEGIDIETDKQVLKSYPQADVTFLVEPQRQVLNEHLWNDSWDIIFFAGHSETEGECGRIYLNPQESLTVSELNYGLKKAAAKGLKLAIFNSCDGLGLAQELQDCQIPYIIVMRELVPDRVAQCFFKYFLENFTKGNPFYRAVREAQQRLQGLEGEFPCATWLPVIYQKPTALPPSWKPSLIKHLAKVVGFSAIATIAIMGMRVLGWLEFLELKTFDVVMEQRASESSIDERILVVEIGEKETNKYGYPLSDEILAKVLDKFAINKSQIIGLDIHRFQQEGKGRKELIRSFQRNKNLTAVCAFNNLANQYQPPPELTHFPLNKQLGFSNLLIDENKNIRRQLLSYDPNQATKASSDSDCFTPYSLSLQLAYRFLEAKGIKPLNVKNNRWQFGSVVFKHLPSRFGGYQHLDGKSSQIMINYRSGKFAGQSIDLEKVLSDSFNPELVREKVILIGYTAAVANDDFDTPIGKLPGVGIHAQMTSQILSAVLDKRPLIWVLSQWEDSLIVFIWCIWGGILLLFWQRYRNIVILAIAISVSFLILYSVSLLALQQGLWLPVIPTIFSWPILILLMILTKKI